MTPWRQTAIVARWEFQRFVKWRQQFIGLAVMLAVGGVIGKVSSLSARAKAKPVTVAVVNASALGFVLPTVPGVTWEAGASRTASDARTAVSNDSVGGALLVASDASAELVIPKRAAWTEPVERALSDARRAATFARLPISNEDRTGLMTPFAVQTTMVSPGAAPLGRATRIFAFLILGTGLMVLLSGFGTLFTGITGEKQQRVTEQMIAMVAPQTWVDGKILGLAGAALVGTGFLLAGGAILARVLAALGTNVFSLPPVASDLGILALVVLITVLGVAMWFAFMAAVAATIDDPNSSTRSLLLFLPMIPLALAFPLVSKADSVYAQALAIFPLTSMAMLPVRLLVTTVPWWEVAAAALLLCFAVWVFRRAAGKIFATAVLMYGKEPTLAEMWRWARQA